MPAGQLFWGSRPPQELARTHAPIILGVWTPMRIGVSARQLFWGSRPLRKWRMPVRQLFWGSRPSPGIGAQAHANYFGGPDPLTNWRVCAAIILGF